MSAAIGIVLNILLFLMPNEVIRVSVPILAMTLLYCGELKQFADPMVRVRYDGKEAWKKEVLKETECRALMLSAVQTVSGALRCIFGGQPVIVLLLYIGYVLFFSMLGLLCVMCGFKWKVSVGTVLLIIAVSVCRIRGLRFTFPFFAYAYGETEYFCWNIGLALILNLLLTAGIRKKRDF